METEMTSRPARAVRAHALAARVELLVQAGPGGIVGDGGELTEAFANIVFNAIEATPPGGCVYVATHVRSMRGSGTTVSMHVPEVSGGAERACARF